jgi:hypothetical protein
MRTSSISSSAGVATGTCSFEGLLIVLSVWALQILIKNKLQTKAKKY